MGPPSRSACPSPGPERRATTLCTQRPERENSHVCPGLASGVEGRKLPQSQKGQPGSDSGSLGVDLWEDAPNLPPHREPSARKVSGPIVLWVERGERNEGPAYLQNKTVFKRT